MGDLSKNFSRREFECSCGCGFNTVDTETLMILEDLREHFGKPVIIISPCRCEEYNELIGGAKHSYHKIGRAEDVVVSGVEPREVYEYLCQKWKGKYGFILYVDKNFVHLDSRDYEYRDIR